MMFCKIIRDADKLDIYRIVTEENPIAVKEDDHINDIILNDFLLEVSSDVKNIKNKKDTVIFLISFIYDINYQYSFDFILKNNYMEKLINLLDEEEQKIIRKKVNEYIQSKKYVENNI